MQKFAITIVVACVWLSAFSSPAAAQFYDPAYAADPYAYAQYYDPYYELHQIHYQLYLRQYGYYPYPYPYVVAAPPVVVAAPSIAAAQGRQPLRAIPAPVRRR
ncbi:MAG TPA: hypothetical protein VHL99_12240 [Candidatus Binatia bacterium]|nr:hypothetical protein [Candidatus Binatia bacterium]